MNAILFFMVLKRKKTGIKKRERKKVGILASIPFAFLLFSLIFLRKSKVIV